jgi:hypothetical protein
MLEVLANEEQLTSGWKADQYVVEAIIICHLIL